MKCFIKRFFASFMLLSVMSLACAASDLTDDYFDIAQNYYKEGNTTKALEYVNQILAIENNNQQAIGLKIKLTPPTSNKALPNLEKPLIFDVPYVPSSNQTADTYYNQGLEQYKNKNYAAAEDNLKVAIQMSNNNFRAYNTLGLVYWAQSKLTDAMAAFEKANSINTAFTVPLENLSQIYKQIGDTEKSYAILLKAQNLNPKDFCAYMLLGDYYRDVDDYENSIKNYKEVIRINPKYNLAYLKIAKVRTDNMDFVASNATLNYYHGLNPKDDYVFYLMAKNYEYMNQYNKARESIYKAIQMNNCVEYRIELGKINYQTDDIQDALENFTSALNKNATSELYNYIGMCYYNLHEFNKAISNINKAISMPDTRVLYYYNLAKIYYTLKDNANYTKYMNMVKDFKPSNCQDYIDLSGILLDSESKNAAIYILNKGIECYPKVKELYLEKLKIYDLTDDLQGVGQTKLEMEQAFK
ncbi:MAG: tetratricopeptide repeat protein [Candidatus Gastranaerophilales bacterium]|nr:tetratricopeptide repeat protein [Candidatus Gastranaerophilales bacterium]